MKPFLKTYGSVILALIAALTILVVAFVANGSEYEHAWLYITAVYFVLMGAWEMYTHKGGKKS